MKTKIYLETFETIKELATQLILMPMDKHLISTDTVHIDLEDIAYVLCVKLSQEDGFKYYMPSPQELRRFNVTKRYLISCAKKNMLTNSCLLLMNLNDVFQTASTVDSSLYVAGYTDFTEKSSPILPFSSLILLDEFALQRIAEHISEKPDERLDDYYILPSSKHEVLITKKDELMAMEIPVSYLTELVKNVNLVAVNEEDVLTDSVYLYDATLQMIKRVG